MVCRVSLKYAVLDDGNVAVGTLGNDIATMEYALAAAQLLSFFSCHNVRKKVQRFDIAVEETGIFHIGQFQTF